MKQIKLFANVMLIAMLILVTACSASNSNGNQPNATNSQNGSTEQGGKQEAPYEIVLGYPILGEVPADIDAVEAAINKITLEKINATVKLSRYPIGQWFQQKNLIMASSEKMDLILTDFETYSGSVAKNQYLELDELISQYGKGIAEALGDNLNVAKIKGNVYATPVKGFTNTGTAILMRKDLLDKYGIDAVTIQSTDDLNAVFATIKQGEPDITVLAPSNGPMPLTAVIDGINVDTLTDGLGVLPNDSDEMKIVNLYELPEYTEALTQLRSWYQAGYLPKDAANTKVDAKDLIRNGTAFAFYEGNTVFLEDQLSAQVGTELVKVVMQKPVLNTQNVLGLMWAIPRNNTQNAEKAMEFLNLMYANEEILNLINFGLEGTHYTKQEDGVIELIANSGYTMNQSFMFGNQLLTYVLQGEDPALRDEDVKFGETVERSKAIGFLPGTDAVTTEVVAVNNVLDQYKKALESGSVDPVKIHPEFVKKLKEAGIDKIIAEKQRQLDEWLAAQ